MPYLLNLLQDLPPWVEELHIDPDQKDVYQGGQEDHDRQHPSEPRGHVVGFLLLPEGADGRQDGRVAALNPIG